MTAHAEGFESWCELFFTGITNWGYVAHQLVSLIARVKRQEPTSLLLEQPHCNLRYVNYFPVNRGGDHADFSHYYSTSMLLYLTSLRTST